MATPERDLSAKTFTPVGGKAVIYIYRDENFGGAIKVPIIVNNRIIGDTVAKSYFRLVVEPGTYDVQCKAESDSRQTIQAEAGKVYFFRQEMKMGFMAAGCKMHVIAEDVGRKAVSECKLLDSAEALPK